MPVVPEPAATEGQALEQGLSAAAWQALLGLLGGRPPSRAELHVIAALWGKWGLRRLLGAQLPMAGGRGRQDGDGRAGILHIGEGWALACGMHSRRLPPGPEPGPAPSSVLGASLRAVLGLGARPLANLNSLRFGPLEEPPTTDLVKALAAGLGRHANGLGIPMLGAETGFEATPEEQAQVTACTLGLLPSHQGFRGGPPGPGFPLLLLDTRGGREGLPWEDPLPDKLLLEVCQALSGAEDLADLQDLGPGGLALACLEVARRADLGLNLSLDQVPGGGEAGEPLERLLGEGPGRLLLVARPGGEAGLHALLEAGGLGVRRVGELTEGGSFRGHWQGQILLDLPIRPLLAGAPEPGQIRRRPAYLEALIEAPPPEDLRPAEVERTLRRLLQSPTVASRRWIFEQFDGTVGGNTLLGIGRGDAGLLRVQDEAGQETGLALAMAAGGSGRTSRLDPFWGAAHAVTEACRNLACVGAEPLGFAVCLNGGNPADPEALWTLEQGCLGLRQACLGLDVPIFSQGLVEGPEGQGSGAGPVLAALGLVGDCAGQVAVDSPDVTALSKVGNRICGAGFRAVHDGIFLLGDTREELGASEYLRLRTGLVVGACPELRLDEELRLGACVREGIRLGLIRSAHATRAGGLLVAALESAFGALEGQGMGCQLLLYRGALRLDSLLFGESAGRIVVSVAPEGEGSLATLCDTHRVPFAKIGSTGGTRITLAVDGKPLLDAEAAELRSLHAEALGRVLG